MPNNPMSGFRAELAACANKKEREALLKRKLDEVDQRIKEGMKSSVRSTDV